MPLPPPSVPPPPPPERRAPTTAAAWTLAGLVVVGWIASSFVLGATDMISFKGTADAPGVQESQRIVTIVALGLLTIAAGLIVVPKIAASLNRTDDVEGEPNPLV